MHMNFPNIHVPDDGWIMLEALHPCKSDLLRQLDGSSMVFKHIRGASLSERLGYRGDARRPTTGPRASHVRPLHGQRYILTKMSTIQFFSMTRISLREKKVNVIFLQRCPLSSF
jgi:hypothetical protein